MRNKVADNFLVVAFWVILLVGLTGAALLVGYSLGCWQFSNKERLALGENVIKPREDTVFAGSGGKGGVFLKDHTIADIVEQSSSCVVNIDVNAKTSPTASSCPVLPQHNFFFGSNIGPPYPGLLPRPRFGSGSGVIIRSDGYILTSNHVIRCAQNIRVTLVDKRVFNAVVVGRDRYTDLALLKIDAKNLPAAKLGNNSTVRPGDWAIAIGSPMRLDHTVSLGIISAIGRSVNSSGAKVELIQTDAAINPGNSGGPLINIQGEVIGINTAMRNDAQNIGFSIPIAVAKKVVQEILEHGGVSHGYLGIYMNNLDVLAGTVSGVLVVNVAPGSPAAEASIFSGDILQKINGQPVKSVQEVRNMLWRLKPGDELKFLLLRKGLLTSASVKLGSVPAEN